MDDEEWNEYDDLRKIPILKEKVKADLHITHNGGLFYITIELISFLSMLSDDTVILEDVYENPIRVSRKVLLEIFSFRLEIKNHNI